MVPLMSLSVFSFFDPACKRVDPVTCTVRRPCDVCFSLPSLIVVDNIILHWISCVAMCSYEIVVWMLLEWF
jgi:hypothetical protein